MSARLLLAVALALSPASSPAAGKPSRDHCRENPGLDGASFALEFDPDDGGPARRWTFLFSHCASSGRPGGPPMMIQRVYRDGSRGDLLITTEMGSQVSSVRLLLREGKRTRDADLGPYFTRDLLDRAGAPAYSASLPSDEPAASRRGLIRIIRTGS